MILPLSRNIRNLGWKDDQILITTVGNNFLIFCNVVHDKQVVNLNAIHVVGIFCPGCYYKNL